MNNISVVIITRNEAPVLANTLQSLQGLTDDLVIVDSGSTDETIAIARQFNAHLVQTEWLGFGPTKNLGNLSTRHDWILSLDADEAIDEELKNNLQHISLTVDENSVYDLSFKTFTGNYQLRFGEYARDHHIRLFNKQQVQWDNALVHEKLVIPSHITIKKLHGYVHHYTMKDFDSYSRKLFNYAILNAQKLFNAGKKVSSVKMYLSPLTAFIINYIFKMGFLDGWRGYVAARLSAFYTFLKYAHLKELWQRGQ
ncbi:MAG: glycosyltransferase family 2 protein [Ferruginibacter sp.]|nr:glycosyltransferase family 2 protein [Ferruginibacter sp.]